MAHIVGLFLFSLLVTVHTHVVVAADGAMIASNRYTCRTYITTRWMGNWREEHQINKGTSIEIIQEIYLTYHNSRGCLAQRGRIA